MKDEYFTTKDEGRKKELLMQKMRELPDNIITFIGGEPPYLEAKLEERTIEVYPTPGSRLLIFFTKLDGSSKEAQLRDGLMPYDITNDCLHMRYKEEIYNIHLKS